MAFLPLDHLIDTESGALSSAEADFTAMREAFKGDLALEETFSGMPLEGLPGKLFRDKRARSSRQRARRPSAVSATGPTTLEH